MRVSEFVGNQCMSRPAAINMIPMMISALAIDYPIRSGWFSCRINYILIVKLVRLDYYKCFPEM